MFCKLNIPVLSQEIEVSFDLGTINTDKQIKTNKKYEIITV